LGLPRFAAKTPDFKPWIFLDFLGFSRPNRDFSIGYGDKTAEEFSSRSPAGERREGGARGHAEAEDRSCDKLNLFSVYSKKLSSHSYGLNLKHLSSFSATEIDGNTLERGPCWRRRAMTDKTSQIGQIIEVMRNTWDLPADCNEGELFTYAEVLYDRIAAGDSKDELYAYLSGIQVDQLEMAKSDDFKRIVDRAVELAARRD
jgi:hypothetical protein